MPTKTELEARIAELEARVIDLETDNALLKKVYESERDRSNEWAGEVERGEKTRAELGIYVEQTPAFKKKGKNIIRNKNMFEWFLERLDTGDSKETAYYAVYDHAVKEGYFNEVLHEDLDNEKGSDWNKSIKDKVRRRLKDHCKRHNLEFPE